MAVSGISAAAGMVGQETAAAMAAATGQALSDFRGGGGGGGGSTSFGDVEDSKSDRTAILTSVQKQIEEYLSVDNLDTDERLRACMDAQGYIPLDDLSQLKMIAELDVNRAIILEAIRGSQKLEMDAKETMVKSLPLVERTTLILRDMPHNARKEEILKIFAAKECGRVKEIRSDIGNTWFVKFYSEQDCLRTVGYLQAKGHFRQNPLHVRVKPSSLHTTSASRGFAPPYRRQRKPQKTTYYDQSKANPYAGGRGNAAETSGHMAASGMARGGPISGETSGVNPYLQNPPVPSGSGGYSGGYGYSQSFQGPPPYRGPAPERARKAPRPDPVSSSGQGGGSKRNPRPAPSSSGVPSANKGDDFVSPERMRGHSDEPPSPKKLTSDYGGAFRFYDKGKFMRAFQRVARRGMPPIPHSMAGRDQRVVSEILLDPMFVVEAQEAAAEREAAVKEWERRQKEYQEFVAADEPRQRYQYGDAPQAMVNDGVGPVAEDMENNSSEVNRTRQKKSKKKSKRPKDVRDMGGIPMDDGDDDMYARLAREYTFAHADVRDVPFQEPIVRDVRGNRKKASRKQQRRKARRKQAKEIAAMAEASDVRDMNDVRDMRDVRKANGGGDDGNGGGSSGTSKKQPKTTWVPRQS